MPFLLGVAGGDEGHHLHRFEQFQNGVCGDHSAEGYDGLVLLCDFLEGDVGQVGYVALVEVVSREGLVEESGSVGFEVRGHSLAGLGFGLFSQPPRLGP